MILKSAWVEKESDRGQDLGKEEDADLDPVHVPDHVIEDETDLAIVKEDDLETDLEIVQVAEIDLRERDLLILKKKSKLKKNSTEDKKKRESGEITFSGAIETSKMR